MDFTHEQIEEMFSYCATNAVGNKFIVSINKQFSEKGTLSQKQTECLNKVVGQHKEIVGLFEDMDLTSSDFLASVNNQFMRTGSLSTKQIKSLRNWKK